MSDKGGIRELIPILFLTAVVCIAVSLLVLTDKVTRDKIEEQEDKEIKQRLKEIFPKMNDFEKNDTLDVYVIEGDNGDKIGIAFVVVGKGYGGEIKMLMGLEGTLKEIAEEPDPNDILLKGMKIIPPISETPGLGAKIEEDWFQEQFGKGITVGDIEISEGNGGGDKQYEVVWYSLFIWEIEPEGGTEEQGIDSITGATISSEGVINSLKDTALDKIELIKDEMGEV